MIRAQKANDLLRRFVVQFFNLSLVLNCLEPKGELFFPNLSNPFDPKTQVRSAGMPKQDSGAVSVVCFPGIRQGAQLLARAEVM